MRTTHENDSQRLTRIMFSVHHFIRNYSHLFSVILFSFYSNYILDEIYAVLKVIQLPLTLAVLYISPDFLYHTLAVLYISPDFLYHTLAVLYISTDFLYHTLAVLYISPDFLYHTLQSGLKQIAFLNPIKFNFFSSAQKQQGKVSQLHLAPCNLSQIMRFFFQFSNI